MHIGPIPSDPSFGAPRTASGRENLAADEPVEGGELGKAFQDFVGQTLFGSMLKAMRSTVGKPAYFHGGQTEEIFQSQLDAALTEELTESSADKFARPMFELFQLQRQQ